MQYKVTDLDLASLLNSKLYGQKIGKSFYLNDIEVLYLYQQNKLDRNQIIPSKPKSYFEKKLSNKNFYKIFVVYSDLRRRGYYVKSGIKFGGFFRVYEKPKEHSLWIVMPLLYNEKIMLHELVAKGRVAHSTRKALLLAIVDQEADVSYYELKWIKP